MARRPRSSPDSLPSRESILRFVRGAKGRVGKREISREFNLGPAHRPALRALLRDLETSGDLAPSGARRFTPSGKLSDVAVVVVTGTDPDGDPIARPHRWEGEGAPPVIFMAPEPRGKAALAPGQKVLARLKPIGGGRYEGRTIKRLSDGPSRILGVYRRSDEGGGRLVPTDRRQKAEWIIPAGEDAGAQPDEIVRAEPLPTHRPHGLKPARIVERLGKLGDARSVSLIVIATHDIPQDFPPDAVAEAENAVGVPLGNRTDLRDVGLVTIDGEDARDFDDAVFAEPDGDGWRLIVAIADVAHYVRPGSELDRSAWTRGNSVYFPDRVVPMLPEALSNGWCSLRPHEDRGCLFVEMRVDKDGRKTAHQFGRGLMRSAARLTYHQVQEDHDAGGRDTQHLYGAFRALLHARTERGTLDLDLPERKVLLDSEGRVAQIAPRPRLDSHRLIEEFMVLANVCAAEELERLHRPCMYRVHPQPSDEKLETLRQFLRGFDISLPPGNQIRPGDLDRVLRKVAGTPDAPLVNEMMLRSQSQASYSPENIGHFGLSLPRYAHFTSPIRRYADLMVHRALLGELDADALARFEETAEHITSTERRAALAERDAIDRYLAAYLADKIGQRFEARISGVTRFGLFVTLLESGASGLVPTSSLPDDYWMFDASDQTLSGRRSRKVFRLAEPVTVILREATPVTGGMVFALSRPSPQSGQKPGPAKPRGRANRT